MAADSSEAVDVTIFQNLQRKIDEDAQIREDLRGNQYSLSSHFTLSHSSLPSSEYISFVCEKSACSIRFLYSIGHLIRAHRRQAARP